VARIALIYSLIFWLTTLNSLSHAQTSSQTVAEHEQKLWQEAKGRFGTIADYAAYRNKYYPTPPQTAAHIALGKQLFHDKALSKNHNISCASCHPLTNNRPGSDGLPHSPGTTGKLTSRNSPTVLNTGLHSIFFWDGRANTLEEQAAGPLLHPDEMGLASEEEVIERVSEHQHYQKAFKALYVDGVTFANIVGAIVSFEHSLQTRDRFDDYLDGNIDALNTQEKRGLRTFIDVGCHECHSGPLLGGKTIEKLGSYGPFPEQNDLGKYAITQRESDKMQFKGCSLRNVGLTAPYFHTGHEPSLAKAIQLMAKIQKNIDLTPQQTNDIEAFLLTLSGKLVPVGTIEEGEEGEEGESAESSSSLP